MELTPTRRLERNERLVKPSEQKPDVSTKSTFSASTSSRADRVAISQQALAYLDEQARKAEEARIREQSSKTSSEQKELDAMGKQLKAMMKCQKIAARVMAGDKVPPEDLRYLEESDPDGYKLALALRKPKKNPKEWKSVLEDEDKAESTQEGASEESAPTAETAPTT